MKIYSINTYKFNRQQSIKTNTPIASSPMLQSDNKLHGLPKSYTSFGSAEKMQETERQKLINLYLRYKDRYEDYKEGSTKYQKEYEKAISDLERERSYYSFLSGAIKPGKVNKVEKKNIYEEKYKAFVRERQEFQKVMANKAYYESLINTNDIEIFEEIKKRLKSNSNAIDNKIAGYGQLKQDLHKLLIDPIQRETAMKTNEKIPPSLLLYGPIGCGKSELAKALGEESGCRVEIMPPTTTPLQFEYEVSSALKRARKHYIAQNQKNKDFQNSYAYKALSNKEKAEKLVQQKSPRTIYIINEVDKYLSPSLSEESQQRADMNKTLLKGVLDHCSEKADGEYSVDAAGMTIIFTTNFPTKVDSEISLRNGKCTRIPVSLPEDKDIIDIMKFYLDKENKRIKENIWKDKRLETIDLSQIPFEAYASITKPDKEKGAIGGAGIEAAIKQAVTNYINNPESYINIQLPMMLSSAQYRITPEKVEEYKNEIDAMGKMYRDIDEQEELILLKDLKDLDMINFAQLKRLEFLEASQNYSKQEGEH